MRKTPPYPPDHRRSRRLCHSGAHLIETKQRRLARHYTYAQLATKHPYTTNLDTHIHSLPYKHQCDPCLPLQKPGSAERHLLLVLEGTDLCHSCPCRHLNHSMLTMEVSRVVVTLTLPRDLIHHLITDLLSSKFNASCTVVEEEIGMKYLN